jgi:hypothetical protein
LGERAKTNTTLAGVKSFATNLFSQKVNGAQCGERSSSGVLGKLKILFNFCKKSSVCVEGARRAKVRKLLLRTMLVVANEGALF